MKKRLSKIFSSFILTAMALFLAGNSVNAEEVSRAAVYDKSFTFNNGVQTYTVPVSGYYKLEVWGAQGGNFHRGGNGGNGGYSVGYVELKKDTVLYIAVGGKGTDGESVKDDEEAVYHPGGYNGGGCGGKHDGAGGGGATHIATANGLLSSLSSNKNAVLIVAGGGGGAAQENPIHSAINGGSGGGLNGGSITVVVEDDVKVTHPGGGQDGSGGSPSSNTNGVNPDFGKGGGNDLGNSSGGGGGGGWYGGWQGNSWNGGIAGTGGSGYIGGCLSTLEYRGSTYTSNTIAGNNSGNGRAAITYLGPVYYRQTVQVRYENADGTFTEYEDEAGEDYAEGSTFTWTREADGIYRKTDVSYVVTEANTSQVTVYRQQYTVALDKGTGIDCVTGGGTYRVGQTVTIAAKVAEGFEFNGWNASGTLIWEESTFEFNMPANNLYYIAVADSAREKNESEDKSENEPEDKSENKPEDKSENKPEDKSKNEPEDESENESEDESESEEVILPLPAPTPTPAPTHIPASVPADDGVQTEDEEIQVEIEELALASAPMPSEDLALRSSIVKGGAIHIPLANIGTSHANHDRNDDSFWKIASAITCIGIIAGMIFLILFLFFRKCKIYDARTEELIGRSLVRKDKKGMFWVRISDAVCEKAGSGIYIVFWDNFVRSHPEKPLKVSVRGKEFYRQVQEKVDIIF